jgi:type VI secretion system protein ImpA
LATLDNDAILAPVSEDTPSGPDLEFDPDFIELERVAQGKPEQQYGDTIIPGEEPDWQEVERLGAGLLARTRDLRVLSHLAVAALNSSGAAAYADIVCLTRDLLAAQWPTVHPGLDPDEDNDPTMRANALLLLGNPGQALRRLRTTPLVRSARLGPVSWRDAAIATGTLTVEDSSEAPNESAIRAAFQDADPAVPQALRGKLAAAAEAADGIGQVFDENSGNGNGPDLSELTKLLRDMGRTIDRYAILPGNEAPAEEETPAEDAAAAEGFAPAAEAAPRRAGGVTAQSLTEVTTRADAIRLLDLVCRYYQRYEPSSPLPMMIERARRLADKNFLEVLRDLAPDGLIQAETVINPREG